MDGIWLLRLAAAAAFVLAACGGADTPPQPTAPPSYTFTVSGTTVVVTDLISKTITAEQQAQLIRQCTESSGVPVGGDCLADLVPQIGVLPNCLPTSARCVELALKDNGSVGVLRVKEQPTAAGPTCVSRKLCDGVEIPADVVKSAAKKTSTTTPSSSTKSTSKPTTTTTTKPSK